MQSQSLSKHYGYIPVNTWNLESHGHSETQICLCKGQNPEVPALSGGTRGSWPAAQQWVVLQ